MKKQLYFLTIIMVVMSLAAVCSATHYWDNNAGDNLWTTVDNWSSTKAAGGDHTAVTAIPVSGVVTYVLGANHLVNPTPYNCVIQAGDSVASGELKVGQYNDGDIALDVLGTFDVSSSIWIGASGDPAFGGAVLTVEGSVTAGGDVILGTWSTITHISQGYGKIYVNDGTLTCGVLKPGTFGDVRVDVNEDPIIIGEVYVDGGTIDCNELRLHGSSYVDISNDGEIWVAGNKVGVLSGYVTAGYIVLNGGTSDPLNIEVSYDIGLNKTVIKEGGPEWAGVAKNPSPAPGIGDVEPTLTLSWLPGAWAESHTLYLGDSFDDVSETATPYAEAIDGNSYDITSDLAIGTTYYWRVDAVDSIDTFQGPIWDFTVTEAKALNPAPADTLRGSPVETTFTWDSGYYGTSHDFYIGVTADDVENATTASDEFKDNVAANTFTVGFLVREATYYWRVDELGGGYTVKGDVWSFTVEGYELSIPILAVTPDSENVGRLAIKLIDGSGMDETGEFHNANKFNMWESGPVAPTSWPTGLIGGWHWVKFDLGTEKPVGGIKVWNFNRTTDYDDTVRGMKSVCIQTSVTGSTDPNEWSAPAWYVLNKAEGTDLEPVSNIIDLGDVQARYVVITANSVPADRAYKAGASSCGLSEIQFTKAIPFASNPYPNDGNDNLPVAELDSLLIQWKNPTNADTSNLYFGTSYNDVLYADTTDAEFVGNLITDHNYYDATLFGIKMGGQYYWRVDTVAGGEVEAGPVWSFKFVDHIMIDDMERYHAYTPLTGDYWADGWVNGTGSSVAYINGVGDYIETTIVRSGAQAMYLEYNNISYAASEIVASTSGTYSLLCDQDFTANGLASIDLWFYGKAGNGQDSMYVTLSDGINSYTVSQDIALDVEDWQVFRVALNEFVGVELDSIDTMTFGIGTPGGSSSGASGSILLDDFMLYVPRCLASEGLIADGDFNGDCRIDNYELSIFAEEWLESDYTVSAVAGIVGTPVASWQFDSAAGGVTAEAISGNDATMLGGAIVTDATRGKVLELDGVDDYLVHNFSLPMQAGTIMHWLKPDANDHLLCAYYEGDAQTTNNNGGGGTDILEIQTGTSFTSRWVGVYQDGYDPDVSFIDVADHSAYPVIGQWVHHAITWDRNGEFVLYINGRAVQRKSMLGMTWEDREHTIHFIGAVGNLHSERFWDGRIDDLRVYDYAVTNAEIMGMLSISTMYYPLEAAMDFYDVEPVNSKKVNFNDLAEFADVYMTDSMWPAN